MNKYQTSLNRLKARVEYIPANEMWEMPYEASKNYSHDIDTLQELINIFNDDFYDHLLVGSECEKLNLYIKDLDCNCIHKVGTDRHDTIHTFNNDIYYYNLQNGEGCSYKHKGSSYKFVKGNKNGK